MRAGLRPAMIHAVLAAGLVALVLWVTYAYVSAERFFYYWDYAVFQDVAWRTASAFRQSVPAGLREVHRSFQDDYNAVFALPLAPVVLLLGDSRLVYELGLAVVTLCPYCLAVGALGNRVAAARSARTFWTAAGMTLLVPMAWVPTLRGYPDAAPAALLVAALGVYLADADRTTASASLVGALLGLAVILRRHFLYAIPAFGVSAALFEAGTAVRARHEGGREVWHRLARLAFRLSAAIAAGALVLLSLAFPMAVRLWSYDFPTLYRGYQSGPADVAAWYVKPYGWAALLLALAGFAAALRTGLVEARRAGFLLLFIFVSALQWFFAVRQLGEQYTLQFTPVVAVGLSALLWAIWAIRHALVRALARLALTAFVVANVIVGLTNIAPRGVPVVQGAFAAPWMPLVRWDFEAVAAFIEELRRTVAPEEGIFVVASSHVINPDLIRHAEWALHGHDGARLTILQVPGVDTRDHYPLGELLEAMHVVVVRPFQSHLQPVEQEIVKVVYDVFAEGQGVAQDFVPAGDVTLPGGETLTVYSRCRATDVATALATLRIIQEAVPERPGTQPDWIVINRRFPSWLDYLPDGSVSWVAHPTKRGEKPSTTLAYIGGGRGTIGVSGTVGFIDRRCRGASLEFATVDDGGRPETLAVVRKRPGEDGRFAVSVAPRAGEHLALSLWSYGPGVSIDYCLLRIDPLAAKPQGP